ncbi:MAG: apolipoprotein N-acyltransferase [Alistipes sp.]|nr:apolipoprotein N-acyltransferase [Alistipes sp.]
MLRKLSAVICSVVLLSAGWLGVGGFTLLAAFVPLLWISDSCDASWRSWRRVFGWALLTFVLWNAATVWWVWNATWVGPIAATLASSTLNMIAFMLYHTAAKRSSKLFAYVVLVSAWIATEYWYTVGEFSFPWLILGNGFCEVPWAVQWYEYTGVFGGSLWVLLSNILIFESLKQRKKIVAAAAAAVAVLPLALSLLIYFTYSHHLSSERIRVSVVQPNVDCYEKFGNTAAEQRRNLLELLRETPADVQFIAMPETALPDRDMDEARLDSEPMLDSIASILRARDSKATVVTGASTVRFYGGRKLTKTARYMRGGFWDIYNSAIAVTADGPQGVYHKSRLVIGVEKTPLPKLFEWLEFLVIDLGGTVGQLGVGDKAEVFASGEGDTAVEVAPAICYEALYGDFMGGFVREGAQALLVISNDGWWGDTPGYKRLFAFCRLRAVEHRRAVARSANTGISGFIDERGDDGERMGWDERGVLTGTVTLNDKTTFYTRHGDYLGRIAELLMLLSMLGLFADTVRRRIHTASTAAEGSSRRRSRH